MSWDQGWGVKSFLTQDWAKTGIQAPGGRNLTKGICLYVFFLIQFRFLFQSIVCYAPLCEC